MKKVVVLNELYKTKYTNTDDLAGMQDGRLLLKTYKTSWVSAEDSQWLVSAVGTAAHFMTATGGLGAGCLVHCEMFGLPAYQATLIADSHTVTVESMQVYKPILSKLGLPDTVDEIYSKPTFRATLKEANQRSNAIFS